MNYSNDRATAGSAPPSSQGRLQQQARDAVGAVAEIGARLDRLLERLRGSVPQAVVDGSVRGPSGPPALDTSLDGIRREADHAHELLGEIEGLI